MKIREAITNVFNIYLKMLKVDRIEANECREETDVSFGHSSAEKVRS